MPSSLPLNALKAFEVAARHESFSKAAEELNVTPAAVSQQIRLLEELMGVRLFHRLNRGLTLTVAGKSGLNKLQDGFRNVNDAIDQIRGGTSKKKLEIWMTPSFASKWLMPRMSRFVALHPEIELCISSSPLLVDTFSHSQTLISELIRKNNIDVAICFGKGYYPDCQVDLLMNVHALPMCSPTLLQNTDKPLTEPKHLANHVLLHDETPYTGRPDWSSWLNIFGVESDAGQRGLHFNQVALALDAAVETQGVVLTLEQLATNDIQKGSLIIPFDLRMELSLAYYIIGLQQSSTDTRILAFKQWLMDEVMLDKKTNLA